MIYTLIAQPSCDQVCIDFQWLLYLDPLPGREVEGEEGQHALGIAKRAMWMVQCYYDSGDERYLDAVTTAAQDYIGTATEYEDGYYIPYEFTWERATGEIFEPPWYSGIAQGVALSLFVCLHKITQLNEFREYASGIYESYRNLKQETGDPRITLVDDDRYYWIEEYPDDPPAHVLNGKNIAIWGLYDYWVTYRTEESRLLLDAAVKTIEDHLDQWRNPGDVSYYDFSEDIQLLNYHRLHIEQLDLLYAITDREVFAEYADLFEDDHS